MNAQKQNDREMIVAGVLKNFPVWNDREMIAHQNDRRAPKAREKKRVQNDRWMIAN